MVCVYSPAAGTFIIPAPPPREFPSEQHAEAALHTWTRDHSYNLSKQKPKKNANGDLVARLFECDKAGWPKNTSNIKSQDRKRGARRSKRIGCPMRIKIVAVDDSIPMGAWKIVYKNKFVRCWTNAFTNFGCHDTSGVEGTHAKMKTWLDKSNGDLLAVFNKLLPWWILNGSRNKLSLARDLGEIPMTFRDDDTLSAVVRIISVWAISKTHELWVKTYKIVVHQLERSVCDGVFRRVHGRPCLHDLMLIIQSHGQLKLLPDQFDKHWWLPVPSAENSTRILEPMRRPGGSRTRSQPRLHQAGYGANSTRRDFSGFELSGSSNSAIERATGSVSFQELLESDDIE